MTRRFAGSSTVIAPHGALETPAAPARFYAKDNGLVFCDVAPFAYHGWKEYQDGVQKEFLETAESIKLTAGKKLKVTRRGMIAWTTEPMHLTEKSKDGKTSETNLRYTGICEKRVAKLGARSRAPFYTDSRELGS